MAHVYHVDMERYSADALELIGEEKDYLLRLAYEWLKDGITVEDTRTRLVQKVKIIMKDVLFEHLKRTGTVRGDYRYDYTLGYCRRKYVEPRMIDVPSKLLDIEAVLPNCHEFINAIMVEAGKLKAIYDIESATKHAREK